MLVNANMPNIYAPGYGYSVDPNRVNINVKADSKEPVITMYGPPARGQMRDKVLWLGYPDHHHIVVTSDEKDTTLTVGGSRPLHTNPDDIATILRPVYRHIGGWINVMAEKESPDIVSANRKRPRSPLGSQPASNAGIYNMTSKANPIATNIYSPGITPVIIQNQTTAQPDIISKATRLSAFMQKG